eukprot:g2513.t1
MRRFVSILIIVVASDGGELPVGDSGTSVVYAVTAVQDATPVISALQNKTSWLQVFNPTYVTPSNNTRGRGGLLVRSQNCTSTPPTCKGTGQRASWLTFAELEPDTGDAGATPQVRGFVGADAAVFGPFDCEPNKTCPDAFGTEDPRLTYDPDTNGYWLLYNAWSGGAVALSLASTADPTSREGWTRHGELFPGAGLGSYKSGALVLRPAPQEHLVIWGCARELRATPTTGRLLTRFNYSASTTVLSVRSAPYWDTGFVEAAMPPLPLATGDLLFFYDSVGSWAGHSGFQSGWAILSGEDPTRVLARSPAPPLPFVLPWEAGVAPWPSNTPNVVNLGGAYPLPNDAAGNERFRVYFGGADAVVGAAVVTVHAAALDAQYNCHRDQAGLGQCVPAPAGAVGNFSSHATCEAVCSAQQPRVN